MPTAMRAIVFICITAIAVTHCSTLLEQARRSDHCFFVDDVCPNQHIKFWLYKNESEAAGAAPILLDPLNLRAEDFEPRLPLKVLIHGYLGGRDSAPSRQLRPVLLQTQPVHVLSVDYETLVYFPCYTPWALHNVPVVAKCLAQLVNNLMSESIYGPDEIHLIGFSLGAQVAGISANWLNRKLHRITGLDPAGPGYNLQRDSEKLDASDADFVDAIHTDELGYGYFGTSGHADFFPNLNTHLVQKGCGRFNQNIEVHICNHLRSVIYYAESITSQRGFWSYPCGSWEDIVAGECNETSAKNRALMGYFVSENATGSYFLSTNYDAPYAKGEGLY